MSNEKKEKRIVDGKEKEIVVNHLIRGLASPVPVFGSFLVEMIDCFFNLQDYKSEQAEQAEKQAASKRNAASILQLKRSAGELGDKLDCLLYANGITDETTSEIFLDFNDSLDDSEYNQFSKLFTGDDFNFPTVEEADFYDDRDGIYLSLSEPASGYEVINIAREMTRLLRQIHADLEATIMW